MNKILISHRGNINGKILERENHPDYIDDAIKLFYDVEVDIWSVDGYIFLGHDNPQYKINIDWLQSRLDKLWIHCKNIQALEFFSGSQFNYFWHDTDIVTLTSHRYMWVYPGKQPIKNSIAVLPEIYNDDVSECMGVCSDYILNY